jgi:hypothetical protein
VSDLEALKAVAALGLTTNDVEDLVNKLSTLSIVTLGPVVASTGLAKNEVVGTEELSERTGTDGVHGTGFKVDEDGTGDILVARGLREATVSLHTKVSTRYFRLSGRLTSLK